VPAARGTAQSLDDRRGQLTRRAEVVQRGVKPEAVDAEAFEECSTLPRRGPPGRRLDRVGSMEDQQEEYLEQTQRHVEIVLELVEKFDLDPKTETPGRLVVRHLGESLVKAMKMALDSGPPEAAQLVATECVVLAETKDHLNWELLEQVSQTATGKLRKALKEAYEEVEEQEDEHLYHTTGWSRELWIDSLGLPAVLPPPEEEKDVKTAIGAARAKKTRKSLL
jgi:hypothetical protein